MRVDVFLDLLGIPSPSLTSRPLFCAGRGHVIWVTGGCLLRRSSRGQTVDDHSSVVSTQVLFPWDCLSLNVV